MKNVEYECRSVKLQTPLGEVSGFVDVLVDDEDECIEPDSETRLRLYQAKYFLEDIISTQTKTVSGFQIAYLLDMSRNSLSKTAAALGLTKERISQLRNGCQQELPQQHLKPFAHYILSCILQMLSGVIDPWAHEIEDYTINPLKAGMLTMKKVNKNVWKTPIQSFITPCDYANTDRKRA